MSNHKQGESQEVMLARIDENVKTLVTRQDDHETRIRGLEKWRWGFAGAVGFITLIAAVYEAFKH